MNESICYTIRCVGVRNFEPFLGSEIGEVLRTIAKARTERKLHSPAEELMFATNFLNIKEYKDIMHYNALILCLKVRHAGLPLQLYFYCTYSLKPLTKLLQEENTLF